MCETAYSLEGTPREPAHGTLTVAGDVRKAQAGCSESSYAYRSGWRRAWQQLAAAGGTGDRGRMFLVHTVAVKAIGSDRGFDILEKHGDVSIPRFRAS